MKEQQEFPQEDEVHAPTGKPEIRSFGNYDLVRRIDVGGMGEVYLARQRTAFGREVAVKIIRTDLVYDVTARKRFQREAEVSAYLKHDHILPLLEFGEEQGRLFLVTPYIKGGTLARRLHNGPLPLDEIYQLFTALAEAVGYLHRRGVVHRDLKPSNILLDRSEDNGRIYVRLIDFGIASLQGSQASAPLTTAGHEMGTVAYMAPERLDGIAAPSNDIYSLGIILYQMISGRLPSDEPRTSLPEPLAYVVRLCTATNPTQRFSTTEALLGGFEQAYQAVKQSQPVREAVVLAQTVQTSPPATPTPTPAEPLSAEAEAPEVPNVSQSKGKTEMKEQNAHEEFIRSSMQFPANSHPIQSHQATGPQLVVSRQATGPQPVVSRQATGPQPAISRPPTGVSSATGPQPVPGRPEIILPPLPGKDQEFSNTDYDAPTSYIDLEPRPGKKRRSTVSTVSGNLTESLTPPTGERNTGKRRFPALALISLCMLLVIGLIAAVSYAVIQASTIATISLMPKTQTVSQVFTLTAKVNAQSNLGSATIPANVLSSQKTSSLQGKTTGTTGCVLGIFDCKQAVSALDVLSLSSQIRPTLQETIKQDLQKQAQAAGDQTIGDIVYTEKSVTSDPQVGTESKTVTVTMTMTGSQEYIKPQDARNMARQLLQQKLKKDYAFMDALFQIGTPVAQSVDTAGTVKLAIAAGGVARYQMPDSVLSSLQNRLKGLKISQARALLAQQPDLDPSALSVRVTFGDTIPNDVHQISIKMLNPSNIPGVRLTPVPTKSP